MKNGGEILRVPPGAQFQNLEVPVVQDVPRVSVYPEQRPQLPPQTGVVAGQDIYVQPELPLPNEVPALILE